MKYLEAKFMQDLRKLNFSRPNSVILANADSFRVDQHTIYFGGSNWKNIKDDIKHVDGTEREYFFICLFTIVVIDITMFTYFNTYYSDFRSLTMYPKFGWSGYGPHYESPKKILLIPESQGLCDFKYLKENSGFYVNSFRQKSDEFFSTYMPEVKTNDFISKIIADREMIPEKDEKSFVYSTVYNEMKNSLKS